MVASIRIMKKIKQYLTKIDTYRYLINVMLLTFVLAGSIEFANAPSNYDQGIAFRPMCIELGLFVLLNMDIKKWLNPAGIVTGILSSIIFALGYKFHLVPDICEYKYRNIIGMGWIVCVLWTVIIVSGIIDIIRNSLWKRFKELNILLVVLLAGYIVLAAVFGHKYIEQIFVIVECLALFYLFLDEKRKRAVLSQVKDAVLLSFVYVMYKSLRYRPYDTERYQLYFGNSNMAGTYLAGVVIVMFTRITEAWKKTYAKRVKGIILIASYILLGFMCSLVLFNYTRTTIAGLMFAFIIALVCELINDRKKGQVVLRYGLVIVSTIAMFYITFLIIRYVPAYSNKPYLFVCEYNDDTKINANDGFDSKKYTTMGSYLRIVFGKWGILIDFEAMENGEEAEEIVVDDRDVTNGRTEVWQRYISNFNLTGHFPRYVYGDDGEIIPHAHNSYFQIIYEDGLITGIIYIIFTGFMCIYGALAIIRNNTIYDLMAFLFAACIMISQCLEWISRPQYILYVMSIFMMIKIVTDKNGKQHLND